VAAVKVLAARRLGASAAALAFALLVAASIGAFFVTTRLKRSSPVVQRLSFERYVSPNGDGRHDTARISFRIKRDDEVTVAIVDENGDEVRTLAGDRQLDKGLQRFRWNGRLQSGDIAPDGEYRVRVGLRHAGRSVLSPRRIFVDTDPPNPVVRYVSPDSISPDGAGGGERARLRFDGPTRVPPTLLVYRTDAATPRLVARRTGRRGSNTLTWDGRIGPAGSDRSAATGNYVLVVRVQDAAGNIGPRGLPPTRRRFGGHPGVRVSYASAVAPLESVRAGSRARFVVRTDGRRYRWRVRRLGSSRSLARGRSGRTRLAVRIPRVRSGLFLLELRVGGHRYRTPFAVQSRRGWRVLVVLPAATWQARNPLDANGDGFSDVLPEDRQVSLRRPFGGSGLPPGLTARDAPVLLFLDRNRLRYDITTDLALTGPGARPAVRYDGILFSGAPHFFPQRSGRLLRAYLEAGGRVAWIGAGGFRRPTVQEAGTLALRPARGRRNLFGEVLHDERGGGLLTVLGDRIEFFRGVGGAFGPFPALEESARPPRGARVLASAGREAERPALSVYRVGQGVVARLGVEGFGRRASASPDVARIMRRTWNLLSR
jgi:hypothetical protein